MPIAISDRQYFVGDKLFGTAPGFLGGRGVERWAPDNPNAQIVPAFVPTPGREDLRRPRMDVGLGVAAAVHPVYGFSLTFPGSEIAGR